MQWVIAASLSALTFALGDFAVVHLQMERVGVVTLFLAYTVLMGVIAGALGYLVPSYRQTLGGFTRDDWSKAGLVAVLFTVAYYTHFLALGSAPNPGYANSLVMAHVALLSLLSYLFLAKPLNRQTITGIILMSIGAYLVVRWAD